MDTVDQVRRSENMRRIKSKGMKPELAVRKAAHGLGFRFRLYRKDLPGKPDLLFPRLKKVIMVHGCFWHGHDDPTCIDGQRKPKSNLGYWLPKLAGNSTRDRKNIDALQNEGYSILVIWECETLKQEVLISRLKHFLAE